ncbi:helix-turn-helix domain-containing protein [Paenibacillus sp. MY03]|uniref:helix-turn-helix domain-containing protein n=1 Tax=Paenibacillus sp. MY03 TaxID=302980 RepID=UPI00277D0747|nr:helix-turn-helix domain-containing protein [Paenibacillus sp. MY03]
MPIMSGMEFANRAKAFNPDVHIVFISGHDDFAYAKDAIRLHAYNYLLKPVDDDELAETIEGLFEKVRRERSNQYAAFEALSIVQRERLHRWLRGMYAEGSNEQAGELLERHLHRGVSIAMIEADDLERHTEDLSPELRRRMVRDVEAFVKNQVDDSDQGVLLTGSDHRFTLISFASRESCYDQLQDLVRIFNQSFPFTITIGIGAHAYTMDELQASYLQAETALDIKWMLGKNKVIRDIPSRNSIPQTSLATEPLIDEMLHAMLQYDLVRIDDCLNSLFHQEGMPLRRSEAYDLILRMTSKLHGDLQRMDENLYELLNWESHNPMILFKFDTIQDTMSWLRRRLFELSELLFAKRENQDRKLILDIMSYVETYLENKVTLKGTASHFGFTPNYLGHLFKLETNMAFSDYLNEVRMRRACRLLDDPYHKVYEIAERIGYKNVIYFNRQFKQAMGMTPGEYRKNKKI